MIAGPLRDRFGFVSRLDYYEPDDLVIDRRAGRRHPRRGDRARRRRRDRPPRPRYATRREPALRRVRDFAEVRADGVVTGAVANDALALFDVDALGLDKVDRAILRALCETFAGQPVGLGTLAVSVSEEPDTVEDVYEPYLLKCGLLQRTPRGRVAAAAAYAHLGLPAPPGARIRVSSTADG